MVQHLIFINCTTALAEIKIARGGQPVIKIRPAGETSSCMTVHPDRHDLAAKELARLLADHRPRLPDVPRLQRFVTLHWWDAHIASGGTQRAPRLHLRHVCASEHHWPGMGGHLRVSMSLGGTARELSTPQDGHIHAGVTCTYKKAGGPSKLQSLAWVLAPPMAKRMVNFPPSSVWIRNALPLLLMASRTLAPCCLLAPCTRVAMRRRSHAKWRVGLNVRIIGKSVLL